MAESGTRVFAEGETALSLIQRAYDLTDAKAEVFSQQYRDKWLLITGTVVNVSINTGVDSLVTLKVGDHIYEAASLYVSGDRQAIEQLNKGDHLTSLGRIYFVSSTGISLSECEIVSVIAASIVRLTEAVDECVPDASKPKPALTDPKPDTRKNLSQAEAEKFCKLLLDGWPSITERDAHKKAAAFFPDNKVPVKAFLEIFRAIRGDKKPGPQPKTR